VPGVAPARPEGPRRDDLPPAGRPGRHGRPRPGVPAAPAGARPDDRRALALKATGGPFRQDVTHRGRSSARRTGAQPMVTLETDRLTLRMIRETDFEAYAKMCADPEVMRYIGDGQALARPMAWRNLALMIGHWSLRGYGLWAAEDRASGALVGRIGF